MPSVLLHDGSFAMEYTTYESRLATFAPPSKRSKTGGWPHKSPSAEALAKAGFYYQPSAQSNDNTICFLCSRNLDGWEKDDNPVEEHLKHCPSCGWANMQNLEAEQNHENSTMEDPTGESMAEARRATFAIGWPHESKRGWTCKIEKMVEAGWYFAPTAECEDYVSCAYCKLSLDGWEPKDKPFEEHYSRSPNCPFFAFAGTTAPSKRPKAKKGRASKSARTSKATIRLSTQSTATIQSEVPSIPDLDDSIDNSQTSILSTISNMSTTSTATTKGKRKATSAKAKTTKAKRAKTTRSKKAEPTPETETLAEPLLEKSHGPEEEQTEEFATAEIDYPQLEPDGHESEESWKIRGNAVQDDAEQTPVPVSPIVSPGPPERESSAVPVMAPSPIPAVVARPPSPNRKNAQAKRPTKLSTAETVKKVSPPSPARSPSTQSDLENAPPSARAEAARPPISLNGTVPPKWEPVDVEMVFGSIPATELFTIDHDLTDREKQMSVQEWIKYVAEKAEEDLRAEGERVVSILEREGQRALQVLEGIVCV